MVRILSLTDQSKAGAWTQVGVLGGGALSGAMVRWLAVRMSLPAAGLCFAAVVAILGYLPFAIPEPAPEPSPWFHGRLATIGREIWSLARSRPLRWGTLVLLSPCATGAAQSLLPAIAPHYGVGGSGVMWINGLGGRCVGTRCIGQHADSWYLGPPSHLCRSWGDKRARRIFPARGQQTVGIPRRYVLLLSNAGSMLGSRSVALIVEIVGADTRDASTLYSLLNAAVSIPVLYVVWLDGVGFRYFGTHGLLLTDALLNLLMFGIVAMIFITRGMGLRSVPDASAPESDSSR
jgi:hypothetical protein